MPEDERLLIHVQGTLRSGSTLLETLLTQTSDAAAIGESLNLYRFLALDLPCSCGCPSRSCPVWSQVAERVGLLDTDLDLAAFAVQFRRAVRLRNCYRAVYKGEIPSELRRIHRLAIEAFADVMKVHTVIDTSKNPALPRLVDGDDWDWSPAYIHLVRDPRAVAFSDSRARHQVDPHTRPPRRGVVLSALVWRLTNHLIEWSRANAWGDRPSMRVRYEDLTADAPATIEAIADRLALPTPTSNDAPEFTGAAVPLGRQTHAIAGNPGRWPVTTTVRSDERWRAQMPRHERAMVSIIAAGALRRYGYK